VLFLYSIVVPFLSFLGVSEVSIDLFGFSALYFENSLLLSGFPLGIGNSL
jgi:hypothetical protein